ncbi:G5 domain-containing protein (plasmid) [Alkalihalophilus sp. As8PL]|uniref:G5 domain-containing protein n=1 Tax=Alkalihalophilus sp. As8PL TaxID=3237103 RepID=A0AB39BP67_9BACI
MFKSLDLFFLRTLIIILFTTVIPLSVLAADNHDDISVIYHVLIDDKRIGTISNKELINDLILAKMDSLDKTYKDSELTTSKNITYIPEHTFFSDTSDEQILNWINENVTIEAVASKLELEDQFLYLKEKEDAEETLNQLKLRFVSSEDLNALTNSEQNSDNKKQVLDVSYSTQPTITSGQVSPDDILSVDEAVNYIIKGSLQEKEYLIQQGDALSTIAPKYQLTIDELLKLNPEYKNDHVLQIGQPLMVTDYQPLTDIIVKEQLNKAEEIEFETNIVEDDTMYKGDSKIKQQGKNGKKGLLYQLTKKNRSVVKEEIIDETIVEEPIPEIIIKGTKVIPSRGTGQFT